MLKHQNDVLLSHARVLQENQETIKSLLKQQAGGKQSGMSKSELEGTRMLLGELIKPLTQQVEEIKKVYEDTKNCANQVNDALGRVAVAKKHDIPGQEKEEQDFINQFGGYIVGSVSTSQRTKSCGPSSTRPMTCPSSTRRSSRIWSRLRRRIT